MPAPPRITLYLDTVSPFAYIAYHVLRNDPVFNKCEVTYVPIFLGGLMNKCGNTPPIKIKNKDKWIGLERRRWAEVLNVPMAEDAPPNFPPLTLPIGRALCGILTLDNHRQTRLLPVLDALWDEFFVKHVPTHEPTELRRILVGVLGAGEADKVLSEASSAEETGGKKALTKNTDLAFDEGAFGLPWMVCTRGDGQKEAFWGVDHLGQVAAFLGLEKPGTGGWKALL